MALLYLSCNQIETKNHEKIYQDSLLLSPFSKIEFFKRVTSFRSVNPAILFMIHEPMPVGVRGSVLLFGGQKVSFDFIHREPICLN